MAMKSKLYCCYLLSDMLKLGGSKPWPDTLEMLTGSRVMDATVLREYFKPLEDWLKNDNMRHQEFIGWEEEGGYTEQSYISSLVYKF